MKIKLTTKEQADLRALTWPPFGQLPTIAAYWRGLYASRGIQWPKQKIPVATPTGQPSEFSISWHGKALGPSAIAAGKSFRALHERKDREFSERLRAHGRGGTDAR